MHIEKIELTNFRNYDKFKLDNLDRINIIIGDNGIGKTSILESIYVSSTARTFKSNDEGVMIKWEKDYLRVKTYISDELKSKVLDYYLDNNGKKTKINNKLRKKISDYIFQYKVILFSPDEVRIIKESPSVRRNYLNVSLSMINKSYIKLLNMYNVLIKNKNDFLKKCYVNSNMDLTYLDILDKKIVEVGLEIFNIRYDYINKVNKRISKIFKKFKNSDDVFIKYESQFLNKSEEDLVKLFKKNRLYEEQIGFTKCGIHKDDIVFIYNGKEARLYSSQGTLKLILLCLKLSELDILKDEYYEEPILLLDDLFSELDSKNQNSVIDKLSSDVQIFITTTDINNIRKSLVKKAKVIDLEESYEK